MKHPEKNTAAENANSEAESTSTGHSVLSLIRGIQSGQIPPKSLSIEDRRRCVEHLTGEGFSTAEIAEILRTIERTVSRDRRAIREANAVEADPAFTAEMIGQLVMEAELARSHIRRVIRNKDTSPIAKIEGERACWTIKRELVQSLQQLGCLPTAPHEIHGDVTHRLGDPPGFDELQGELDRLAVIVQRSQPGDDSTKQQVTQLRATFSRLELGEKVQNLTKLIEKEPIDEQQP
ncbi:MAG: hypothetical protein IH830_03470 [Planctomycetes bacterium]|nr:hypothetical protein [Planctomycetota bacterium]